jgi:hypothetical protein
MASRGRKPREIQAVEANQPHEETLVDVIARLFLAQEGNSDIGSSPCCTSQAPAEKSPVLLAKSPH